MGKNRTDKRWEECFNRQKTQRRRLCTLNRFNLPCSLDNQEPHGHAPATGVPQRLCRVVDETHHITGDIRAFITGGCDEWWKGQNTTS